MRYVVDGMNLIGSRPDGWWRDRPAARLALSEELGVFARRSGHDVTVVFDGSPGSEEVGATGAVAGIVVRYAPGGPDAADDVVAALVAGLEDPTSVTVVTSDAGLAGRVGAVGAAVVGSRAFRRSALS